MIQAVFFALLIISLLAGYFAYFNPAPKPINPVKFAMENSGYNSMETINRKRSQVINMTTSKGLMQVRRMMDDLSLEQDKFLDTLQDQQQILKDTNKDAHDVLLELQKQGDAGRKDVLQLKALTSEMQDEQKLLVTRGHDLILLNDQLTKSRQLMSDQMDLARINTDTSLSTLQQRYSALDNQAASFFNKITEHNQEVHDRIENIKNKLQLIAKIPPDTSTVQQQNANERIQRMLDKEHEDILRLADTEEKSKDLVKDAQEKQADAKEQLNEKLQQSQDKIADEHQKEEDQQLMVQQRIADQQQRIQDQQDQQADRNQ